MRRALSHILPLTLTLIAIGVLSACKSSRHTDKTGQYPEEPSTEQGLIPGFPPEASGLVNASRAKMDRWQTLQMPFSVSVQSPASLSASGTLSMINGRSIDLSVRLLGFEVAAAHIEGDSVVAIVKPARIYLSESISKTLGGMAVNVSDLQAILLGSMVDPALFSGKGCDITLTAREDGQRLLSIITADASAGLGYLFAADTPVLNQIAVAREGAFQGVVSLNDYTSLKELPQIYIPAEITFDGQTFTSKREASGQLKLNVGRAKVNTTLSERRITIPSGYRKVTLASLLNKL